MSHFIRSAQPPRLSHDISLSYVLSSLSTLSFLRIPYLGTYPPSFLIDAGRAERARGEIRRGPPACRPGTLSRESIHPSSSGLSLFRGLGNADLMVLFSPFLLFDMIHRTQ